MGRGRGGGCVGVGGFSVSWCGAVRFFDLLRVCVVASRAFDFYRLGFLSRGKLGGNWKVCKVFVREV